MNYDIFEKFCDTDTQRKYMQSYCEIGTRKTAKKFGKSTGTISNVVKKIKDKAIMAGELVASDSLALKGTSVMFKHDEDGTKRPVLNWVKTDKKIEDTLADIENYLTDKANELPPIKPTYFDSYTDDSILVKYPIGDAHIGLLTWKEEVGASFGLEEAKSMYLGAMEMLVKSSPNSHTALIIDLGDYTHNDDQTNRTKGHGHQLDVDGRFGKIFDTAVFIAENLISIALTKHENVIYRVTSGNHNPTASIAIGAVLEALYRNEPRVKIERSPSLFWWYQFGKTLHFSTHGHTVKKDSLPEIMAHDCKEIFSETDYRYIDVGHFHHKQVVESRIATIEVHNSMAAGDSYNFGSGYRSQRVMKSITYHKEHGEIARSLVRPDQLNLSTTY